MATYVTAYRCRICGELLLGREEMEFDENSLNNIELPSHTLMRIPDTHGYFKPIKMLSTHRCDGGSIGIMDMIGLTMKLPEEVPPSDHPIDVPFEDIKEDVNYCVE